MSMKDACLGKREQLSCPSMLKRTHQESLMKKPANAGGGLLCLMALSLLIGCQGLSSGGSGSSGSGSGSGTPGSSGSGQLAVSPATLALGSAMTGTSTTASASLTASGASVTVTAANSDNSQFSVSGLSLPVTIDPGQTVPFTVTFSPSAVGSASGTLSFTSNAQSGSTVETLGGTGTQAPTHAVSLSWDASPSTNISGYNIYRGTYIALSCGAFTKINATLNTDTAYTDSSVTDGTSYCYATTAVNSSNQESGFSNVASNVQIPAP